MRLNIKNCHVPKPSCLHTGSASYRGQRQVCMATGDQTRRDVVHLAASALTLSLAQNNSAVAASVVSSPAPATSTGIATFNSAQAGFQLSYPESWVVAIDRGNMQAAGTLVVVGDFNEAVTLNISRTPSSDYGLATTQPTDPDLSSKLSSALLQELRSTPGLFNLSILQDTGRIGSDGRTYADLEFKIETCRVEIIEGLRGRQRCVGPDDVTVPTFAKHIFQTAVLMGDGYVYTATGGAYETKWSKSEQQIVQAVKSLRFGSA